MILPGLISMAALYIAAKVLQREPIPWGAVAIYWLMVTGYWVARAIG
jgi:hypothetical protein